MSDLELADDLLPIYDVSDAVATVADADRETAWRALLDVDLVKLGREAPVVGMLGALRLLPEVIGHLLHGERRLAERTPRTRHWRQSGRCGTRRLYFGRGRRRSMMR